MSSLRQRMIDDLKVRNYSEKTIKEYVGHVARFARHFGTAPNQLGPDHIRDYQIHLVREKKASFSYFNQAVCALRFFYTQTLGKDWHIRRQIPYARKERPLPVVLNLPGYHNVLNALAAIAVARELDIDDASVQRALKTFAGIDRRFQMNGEIDWRDGSVLFVDDYGHHPREIAATLAAVRSGWRMHWSAGQCAGAEEGQLAAIRSLVPQKSET